MVALSSSVAIPARNNLEVTPLDLRYNLAMYRRTSFAPGEWYHCYTRGVDKRKVYLSNSDYARYIQLMYLANDTQPIERSSFGLNPSHEDLLHKQRTDNLVTIGAYTLMPNHFHFLVREEAEGGITRFMRKIGTGYTMYFNIKHKRVGNLFLKPFRSKHVPDDRYAQRVVQYIHLNAAELFEPEWKSGVVRNEQTLLASLSTYPYSSLPDYYGQIRAENGLLGKDALELFAGELPPLKELIGDYQEYYQEVAQSGIGI